jgi:hypothetical protein
VPHFETYRRFLPWLAAAVVVAAVFVSTGKQLRREGARGDVEVYVHAARVLVAGGDIYTTQEPRGRLYYVYPPLFAFLFVPLVYLPYELVVVLWCVLNVLLAGWVVKAFYEALAGEPFSALPPKSRWVLGFFPVLMTARAILYHLDLAQANIFAMAVAVFGLRLLARRRELAAGFAVGLSIVVKVIALPLSILFVARAQVRVIVGLALGLAAGLLLPALVFGFERNAAYVAYWAREVILSTDLSNSYHWPLKFNFSLAAQLYRFFSDLAPFEYEGRLYYFTVARLPNHVLNLMGKALTALTGLSILYYGLRHRRRRELVGLWGGVALAFCLVPIFSTVSQKHYFVMLLPAHVYVVYLWHCLRLKDRRFRGLVVASFVVATLSTNLFGYLPGAVVANLGGLVWGALLLAASIFRAANVIDDAPAAAEGKS